MSSNLPFTIIAFVLTLGLVIIVHELGHFLFCKLFGIYVKTFSIGIGPKMLRKRFGETEYVLSAIPFGGYVKMAGEGIMEEIQDTGTWEGRKYPIGTEEGNREAAAVDVHIPAERHFSSKPAWQRLAVFVAGPLFNLLLAFVVYTCIVLQTGIVQTPVTRVGEVAADSPAAAAGLAVGDRILQVAGQPVALWEDVQEDLIKPSEGDPANPRPVQLMILRGGRVLTRQLTPRFLPDQGLWTVGMEPWDTTVGLVQRGGPAYRIGLREDDRIISVDGKPVTSFGGIAKIINRSVGREVQIVWERNGQIQQSGVVPDASEIAPDSTIGRIFFDRKYVHRPIQLQEGLRYGAVVTWRTIQETTTVLRNLVTHRLGIEAVSGPIRIGQVAGEMLRWGFAYLMNFIAFFSVNLFLLNLLPIPVLDGGHVLFLLIEVVRGRRVHERVQAIATQVGLIFLLLFMTFIVVKDVLQVAGH